MANIRKMKTPSVVAPTQGAIKKTATVFNAHTKRSASPCKPHNYALRWITRRCAVPAHMAPTIAFLASIKGGQAND